MKTLYVFDDYQLSLNNGVGTYIKELTRLIDDMEDVRMVMIMLRSNTREFNIYDCNGIEYYLFPQLDNENIYEKGEYVANILQNHIKDDKNTFFLFNYTPCENVVAAIRSVFSHSYLLCIIHDMTWTALCLGNVNLFKDILFTHNEKYTTLRTELTNSFQRELKQFEIVDKIICLSKDTIIILKEIYGISPNKLYLIPHGVKKIQRRISYKTKTLWRNKLYIANDEIILLTVSRISQSKGVYAFLEAFKQILQYNIKCRWVIIGNLCELPKFLSIAGSAITHITITGHLDTLNLKCWYQIADIGIIPSYTEQCSYVGLEMMKYGLPIVASDGFGMRCMFPKGLNAAVAHIGNRKNKNDFSKNLYKTVLNLLQDKQVQKRIRKNAYSVLKHCYNYDYMKNQYSAIFYGKQT